MKKLFATLMTMAIVAVLGLGNVGCSKDTKVEKKTETKTDEKRTTETPGGTTKTTETKTEEKKTEKKP